MVESARDPYEATPVLTLLNQTFVVPPITGTTTIDCVYDSGVVETTFPIENENPFSFSSADMITNKSPLNSAGEIRDKISQKHLYGKSDLNGSH